MTLPSSDERDATHEAKVLDVLARTELSELCRRIATELNGSLKDAAVAILLVDASGKQLLVTAAVGLPSTVEDVVLATAAAGERIGAEVARAVEERTPWLLGQHNEAAHLPGIGSPIAAIVPIVLPGGSRAHGAVVILSEREPDAERTTMAAQLIALHIEAALDRTHPVGNSTRLDSGLPDEAHLIARIERCRDDRAGHKLNVVFSVRIQTGPYHAPPGEELARDDLGRVAAILQQCVRPQDLVAHLGGPDFAVVATDLGSDRDVANFAIRIVEAVSGTAEGSDHPVGVYEARVGGALIDNLSDSQSLLDKAVAAREDSLDRFGLAREPVSTRVSTAAPSSHTEFDAKVLLTALREGQIQPWYQPVFELSTVRTVAVEALARWIRPDDEMISPGEFLPAIQHHHLMSRLTSTILRAVIRDQAVWHAEGLVGPDFAAAVNISMSDVTGGMLPAVVGSLLDEYQLDPSYISLELTETEAMADVNYSLAMLHQLRDLGVGLSIDDFGTGYSSLSYLSQLPVDVVKIDRVFVAGLDHRRGDEAIIGAVVDVANAVGLTVLAEGIETEEQLHQLADLGVKLGQGFLVAPALRPDAVLAHLESQSARL